MEELETFIKQTIKIEAETLQQIVNKFENRELKKGKHFLKHGQVCNHYVFVVKGILRIYTVNNGQEINSWVAMENEFFTDLSSMNTQKPTIFYFQALENTQLAIIDGKTMAVLYQTFPQWQEFGRKMWEQKFIKMLDGILSFQRFSSKERYDYLIENTGLLHRVPLKILSSYIGITSTSLSRLRKKNL
jgi:signal-transduction protein with cAMP-binding, CBS, and nucleotidyltransferase domain